MLRVSILLVSTLELPRVRMLLFAKSFECPRSFCVVRHSGTASAALDWLYMPSHCPSNAPLHRDDVFLKRCKDEGGGGLP
jgi:hypothetical protein